MAERQTATTVANYLSAVETNSVSENDDDDSIIEEDIDDNEAGGEVEATPSDELPEHDSGRIAENGSQPGSSETGDIISGNGGSLPELLPKKGTTSEVWRHFGLRHKDGVIIERDKPVCKYCCTNISAKDGNTTNLYSHLKNKHPNVYATTNMKSLQPAKRKSSDRDPEQPTIQDSFLRGQKLPTNGSEHKKLTKSITYWLAKDAQPEYSVEKPGFQQMIKTFCPRYQLPSRNYFSRTALPKLFSETYQQIQTTLTSKEVSYFSATADLWTSCARDPFLSFTLHHISPQWELLSNCLCTRYIVDDHTGENLKEFLLEVFAEWDLSQERLVAITTDSGANVKLACRLLQWKRLSCFGHNLDLSVNKGLQIPPIPEILKVCRQVVSKFSHSWKKTRDITLSQEDNDLPSHKLKVDCATRWGSTCDMLIRISEQQKAICVVLASDRKCIHLLSLLDFDVIDSVIAVLKPLHELTDLLAAEKRVSVSAVKPLVASICSKMLALKDNDTELAKDMKERIKCDLLQRYSDADTNQLLSVCSFLDPRFKKRLTEEDMRISIEFLKKELLDFEDSSEDGASASLSEPRTKRSAWSRILGDGPEEIPANITTQDKITQEIESYLRLPVHDIDDSPLKWWKSEDTKFPLLAKMAKKYLCVCATSVASERVFSLAGYIASNVRNCLKPSKIDQLTFLARNLQ